MSWCFIEFETARCDKTVRKAFYDIPAFGLWQLLDRLNRLNFLLLKFILMVIMLLLKRQRKNPSLHGPPFGNVTASVWSGLDSLRFNRYRWHHSHMRLGSMQQLEIPKQAMLGALKSNNVWSLVIVSRGIQMVEATLPMCWPRRWEIRNQNAILNDHKLVNTTNDFWGCQKYHLSSWSRESAWVIVTKLATTFCIRPLTKRGELFRLTQTPLWRELISEHRYRLIGTIHSTKRGRICL